MKSLIYVILIIANIFTIEVFTQSPTTAPTSYPTNSTPTTAPTSSPTFSPVTASPTFNPVTSLPTKSPTPKLTPYPSSSFDEYNTIDLSSDFILLISGVLFITISFIGCFIFVIKKS
jgi:hypothetical protein